MHKEFPTDLEDTEFLKGLIVKGNWKEEVWKIVVIWLESNPLNKYFFSSIIFTDFYGCEADHGEHLSFWSHVQILNVGGVKIAPLRQVGQEFQ